MRLMYYVMLALAGGELIAGVFLTDNWQDKVGWYLGSLVTMAAAGNLLIADLWEWVQERKEREK